MHKSLSENVQLKKKATFKALYDDQFDPDYFNRIEQSLTAQNIINNKQRESCVNIALENLQNSRETFTEEDSFDLNTPKNELLGLQQVDETSEGEENKQS